MSEETYYDVLGVSEAATQAQIKAAYRTLMKQVHPDTLPQTSAYWKKIAEDKAKELTEAYKVLADGQQRANYDSLLKSHRQQSVPATQQPARSNSAPQKPSRSGIQTRYDWRPLKRWTRNHTGLVFFLGLLALVGAVSFLPDSPQATQPSQSPQPSQINASPATINSSATDPYSEFPCDNRQTLSPIDGKRCKPAEEPARIDFKADEVEVQRTPIKRPSAPVETPQSGTASLSNIAPDSTEACFKSTRTRGRG